MKTQDKDKLKSLFREIKLENPSADFESRLMSQVHLVVSKQKRKKRLLENLKIALAIGGGLIGMAGVLVFLFHWLGFSPKVDVEAIGHSFVITMSGLQFDPLIISIACVGLVLLVSDTLIRRHIWEKKHRGG